MRVRLQSFWERLRSSYWFLPSLMALASALLSFGMIWLDTALDPEWLRGLGWVYRNQPDGARALLSTVAGSVITVGGVTFSVTIVVLSLASQQFGPRLLHNFMRDRGNQVVLGTFVATFLYSLLVLRTVRSGDFEFVPQLAATLAVVLAAVSVGVFIYFIHHTAESINVSTIIARVSHNLTAAIHDAYPERRLFAEALGKEADEVDVAGTGALDERGIGVGVAVPHGGYLQALDKEGLFQLAKKRDLVIKLHHRPGDFVMSGGRLLTVWPAASESDGGEAALDEELAAALLDKFAFGAQRSQAQDLDFLFDQLTEIAVRAVSPAVNDPFTAMMCLDRLGDGLALLGNRSLPATHRYDEAGRLRVVVPPLDLSALVDHCLGPIRRYAGDSLLLYLHLLGTIRQVMELSHEPGLRRALLEQVRLVQETGCARLIEADCRKLVAACLDVLAEFEQGAETAPEDRVQRGMR